MAKKKKQIDPVKEAIMNSLIQQSYQTPLVSAPVDYNGRFNYIDASNISTQDVEDDPWKFQMLEAQGKAPNDYGVMDYLKDAFTDWKVKQNDTNIDSRRADLINLQQKRDDVNNSYEYVSNAQQISQLQGDPDLNADPNKRNMLSQLIERNRELRPSYEKIVMESEDMNLFSTAPSLKGFTRVSDDTKYDMLQKYNDYLNQEIDSNAADVQEYQQANEHWKNKHKLSSYFEQKQQDNDLDFTDVDTYLYGVPGLIGSSSSSWKTTLAAWTVGLGTSAAIGLTGGTAAPLVVGALGAASTFGLGMYGATEENKAEMYQHYRDQVKQLSEADGSLSKILSKVNSNPQYAQFTDDEKLDLILSGSIDVEDPKFDQNRLSAFKGLNQLYQDDMVAVMGSEALETAMIILPIGSLAKLGKLGNKAKKLATKSEQLYEGLRHRITDLTNFGKAKTVEGLSRRTLRNYILDVPTRTMISSASEMMEESNQYLNGERYMQGKYGDDHTIFDSVLNNLGQGTKSLYSFYAPWDTALSSDPEWLENARGGSLLGMLMTGSIRTIGGAVQTSKQMAADKFVSEMAMTDRLYEKDLLRKNQYYADKAVRGKTRQVLESFDKLKGIEGFDADMIDAEKKRAARVMTLANSKALQTLATDKLGINTNSEEYNRLVSMVDYYNQMYNDARDTYDQAVRDLDIKIDESQLEDYLNTYVIDREDPKAAESKQAMINMIRGLSELKALQKYKQAFDNIKEDSEELGKLGITTNKLDIDEVTKIIDDRIKTLNKYVDGQELAEEDTQLLSASDEIADAYESFIPHYIEVTRAQNALKDLGFDSKKLGNANVKEIQSRLNKMTKAEKDDIEFQERIQDAHEGISQQDAQVIPLEQPTVATEIKEDPIPEPVNPEPVEVITPEVQDTPKSETKPEIEPIIETPPAQIEEKPEPTPDVKDQEQETKHVEETPISTEEKPIEQAIEVEQKNQAKIDNQQQKELDDLRNKIIEKRSKKVTIGQKKVNKSQRSLDKTRAQLQNPDAYTDEELSMQPDQQFTDNSYGRAIQRANDEVSKVYKALTPAILDQLINPDNSWKYNTNNRDRYFLEQDLDALQEEPLTEEQNKLLTLYDDLISNRDSLINGIFDVEDGRRLTPIVNRINSISQQIDEILDSIESQQQSESVKSKIISYSRTQDAQLDGIVGATFEENKDYIENSVKPDFITDSTITVDEVDGDIIVTFHYKGKDIKTKMLPSQSNVQLLDKLREMIKQVKQDPNKEIQLIGLARTNGLFVNSDSRMPINQSPLWNQSLSPMDITADNTRIGIATGGPNGQIRIAGLVVRGNGSWLGQPMWAIPVKHNESTEVKYAIAQSSVATFRDKPGIAQLVLDLILSKDTNVTIGNVRTPFTPQQLLDMLVYSGPDTLVGNLGDRYSEEQRQARIRKQFSLDTEGNLILGSNVFNIAKLNSDPVTRQQALDYIMNNLTFRVESNALFNYYGAARAEGNPFNGLRAWFLTNKTDKLTIVPGELEFTLEQVGLAKQGDKFVNNPKYPKGISMLGWYIHQGIIQTNTIGLRNASTYFKDAALVDKVASNQFDVATEEAPTEQKADPTSSVSLDDLFSDLEPGANYATTTLQDNKINLEHAKSYINRVLGVDTETSESVIEITRAGTYVLGKSKLDSIALSELAPEGTEYHEAWHRVSNLLINEKKREAIFSRARKKYGRDLSDVQIDEILAEDFKEFMLDDNIRNTDFQARSWFRKIRNFIKVWSKVGNLKLAKLYYDINYGKFANVKPNQQNIDRFTKLYSEGANFEVRGQEMSSIPTRYAYDEILNSLVYITITQQLKLQSDINKISNIFNHVDNIDLNQVRDLFKGSDNKVFKEIYDKWNSVFAKDLAKKLSNIQIKMINKEAQAEEQANDAGDNGNNDIGEHTKAAYEASLYDNAPAAVKFFFNTIPAYTYNSEGKVVLKKDPLTNLPQFVDPTITWNIVLNDLHNCNSILELQQKVSKLAENNLLYASVRDKLNKVITNSKSQDHKVAMDAEVLLTQIYSVVHSHIHTFLTIKTQELESGNNTVNIIDNTVDIKSRVIPTQWAQQLMKESIFTYDKDGNVQWSNTGQNTLRQLINRYNSLVKAFVDNKPYVVRDQSYDLNTPFGIAKAKDDIVKILNMLGITVDVGTIDTILKEPVYGTSESNDKNRLTQFLTTQDSRAFGGMYNLLNTLSRFLQPNISLNGLEIRRGTDLQFVRTQELYPTNGFVKQLANNYVQYHNNTDELRSYAAGGNLLYPKSQNNFATDRVSELNTDEELRMQLQNVPYNQSSLVLNAMLDENVQLSAETLVNFKTSSFNDTGSDYFGINTKEDYIAKMTLILNDRILFPTIADKKTYHTIKGIKLFHNPVNIQTIPGFGEIMTFDSNGVDQMIQYANSDLAAVEQCIQQLEGYTDENNEYHPPLNQDQKIKNYHTDSSYTDKNGKKHKVDPNGTRFRFLTGLYAYQRDENGNWKEVYIDLSDPKKSSKELVKLAKKEFFDKTPNEQARIMNRLLQKRIEDELAYAAELGVIDVSNGIFSSKLIDFSQQYERAYKHLQTGQEVNDVALSRGIIDIIADNTINTIVSINEIERLFNGDPAYYKWTYNENGLVENSIDKIKRLGALTSTGTNNRLDIEGVPTEYTCTELKDFEKGSDMYIETIKPLFFRGNVITAVKQLYGQDALFNEEGQELTHDELVQKYPEAVKYAEIATEKEASGYAEGINVADAAVYVTPKMYRNMMRMIGEWGVEQEEAYNIIESDNDSWMNDIKLYNKMRSALLKPLKYMAFGNRFQNDLAVPYFDKMALFPLFKQVATGDMKALYDTMKERNIDMVLFNSAVKAGSQDAQSYYTKDGNIADLSKLTTYQQPFKYLRHQLKTDPHTHEESMLGTQMQKVALSNLGMKERYGKDKESTGKQIRNEVFASMNALSNIGRKFIENELCNPDGSVNEEKLAKALLADAETQDANDNIINALTYKDGKMSLPLSALSENSWIESRFIAYINKHTIDINLPGGSFIQRSAFGITANDSRYITDLMLNDGKPLKMINEEGSMDAIVSINLFKHIIPNYNKLTFNQAKQWLIDHNIIGQNSTANSIGYRIPTQSQASISALRFVDVLPEIMGDTVVLPEEFTKLTGSDFDVDKLFISRYAYDKEGNKIEFDHSKTHDENSEAQNKNNLVDQYLKVLLTTDHTNELKISIDNDTENVKTVLKDIESIQATKYVTPFFQYSPKYQSQKKEEYTSGKAGIGPFALNNAHHVLTQLTHLQMVENEFTKALDLVDAGKIYDDATSNRSGERTRVLSWLSALINAFVDIAKDPYITRLNVNAYTYNITAYLLRMGKGENTFYFLNQPIMKDIAQAVLKTRGKYGVDQHLTQSQRENAAIEEVIKKYDPNSSESKAFKAVMRDNYAKSIQFKDLFKKDFLRNIMNMSETDPDYNTMQIYIYYAFKELSKYAQSMSDLVKYSKIDTKRMGNSFAEQRVYDIGMEDLTVDPLFGAGEVRRFYNETFLQTKRENSIHFGNKLFENQLIRNTQAFLDVQDLILDKINRRTTANAKILKPIIGSMQAAIKSQFFNQKMQELGLTAKDLLYGENSMASRLVDIKQKIYSGKLKGYLNPDGTLNNTLLNFLISNIGKYEKKFAKPDFIDTYSMFDQDVNGQNSIIDSWQELYDSVDPEVSTFARDLIYYSFITSGDNAGMNNFFKYLPNKMRRDIGYADYIEHQLEQFKYGSANISWKEVFLNNWQNDNLVKPIKYYVVSQRLQRNEDGDMALVTVNNGLVGIDSPYTEIPGIKYPILETFVGMRTSYRGDDIKPIGYKTDALGATYPIYPPYVKIKYFNENTPNNTMVYELTGMAIQKHRRSGNTQFIPVYHLVDKKGYKMQGNTITEYGRTDNYSFNRFPISNNSETARLNIVDLLNEKYSNNGLLSFDSMSIESYDSIYNTKLEDLEVETDKTLDDYMQEEPELNGFVNHSGGALGSDTMWAQIGEQYGVTSNHYYSGERSQYNSPNGNVEITQQDYEEGRYKVAEAAKANWGYQYATMKDSRLIRNWAQVKYSDAIYAIGNLIQSGQKAFPDQKNDSRVALHKMVTGGTGYAVEMAIQEGKPVYVFDQQTNKWYKNIDGEWSESETPTLTQNFAGIGTRNISEDGIQAIRDVYEKTIGVLSEESDINNDEFRRANEEGEQIKNKCKGE